MRHEFAEDLSPAKRVDRDHVQLSEHWIERLPWRSDALAPDAFSVEFGERPVGTVASGVVPHPIDSLVGELSDAEEMSETSDSTNR